MSWQDSVKHNCKSYGKLIFQQIMLTIRHFSSSWLMANHSNACSHGDIIFRKFTHYIFKSLISFLPKRFLNWVPNKTLLLSPITYLCMLFWYLDFFNYQQEKSKKTVATYYDILSTYLPAITNILRENAIVVAKSISVRCQTKCSHRVQKARGKSTKTTVAKTGIFLDLLQLLYVHAQLSVIPHSPNSCNYLNNHIYHYKTHRDVTRVHHITNKHLVTVAGYCCSKCNPRIRRIHGKQNWRGLKIYAHSRYGMICKYLTHARKLTGSLLSTA